MPKCRICKTSYKPKFTSLQKTCNNFECMIADGKKIKAKAVNDQAKHKAKVDKEFKQRVKIETLPYQHKLTQKAFNRMRVLSELMWFKDRDIEPYCISCQKTNMDWCCGHFKSVGHQSGLRYDPMNTFLQCNRYCNMGLSGNISGNKTTVGYKAGLILRFGEASGNRIIDFCETTTDTVDWYWEDLKKGRATFNKRIRELESHLEQC